jgi:hypothetical protein
MRIAIKPVPTPTLPAADVAPKVWRLTWPFCFGCVLMLANVLLFGVWLVNAIVA